MSHFINMCSCGYVLSQCRCPSYSKTVTVIKNGCGKCHGTPITLTRTEKISRVHGQPFTPPSKSNWQINKDGVTIEITYDDLKYLYNELHNLFHGED